MVESCGDARIVVVCDLAHVYRLALARRSGEEARSTATLVATGELVGQDVHAENIASCHEPCLVLNDNLSGVGHFRNRDVRAGQARCRTGHPTLPVCLYQGPTRDGFPPESAQVFSLAEILAVDKAH